MSKASKCFSCGKNLKRRQHKFCSNKCRANEQYNFYIKAWKLGLVHGGKGPRDLSRHVRKYLLEKYNNCCAKCGWAEKNKYSKKIPLEIHHKDGDATNHSEKNLIPLCPNCHALTKTHDGLNSGRGRKKRAERVIL